MRELKFPPQPTIFSMAPLALRSPLIPINYSLTLKAAMWVSSISTLCLLLRTAISCVGRETWAVFGNGQARR